MSLADTVASLIPSWLTATESGQLLTRSGTYALAFILVDYFVLYGPPAKLIPRIFGAPYTTNKKKAQRLVSQVAARLVGAIFLTMMFPQAFRIISGPEFQADKLYYYDDTSINCMVLAAGYFFYDVFICLTRYAENGAAFLVHAVFCCWAYYYAATSHHIHYFGTSFLLWELSTPLLYVRWAMLKAGKADTALMHVVNFGFMAVFFGCRIILGPLMTYDFVKVTQKHMADEHTGSFTPAATYGYYTAAVALNGLNMFWFIQMTTAALGVSKAAHIKKKAV